MLPLLLACTGVAAAPTSDAVDSAPATCDPAAFPAVEVVKLTTADGITLEADWYTAREGDAAVILLHMIPPTWDRTSWDAAFILALRSACRSVLVIDRRGAGGSGGTAADAYTGDLGVNDARAAVDYVRSRKADGFTLVGASNGTTTALDYATTAVEAGYAAPLSMVFWSPGQYTETNHRMNKLDLARLMLVYPDSEAAWPEAKRARDPGTWTFLPYVGNKHGTMAFGTASDPSAAIVAFIRG